MIRRDGRDVSQMCPSVTSAAASPARKQPGNHFGVGLAAAVSSLSVAVVELAAVGRT